jgi:hypothetical protein
MLSPAVERSASAASFVDAWICLLAKGAILLALPGLAVAEGPEPGRCNSPPIEEADEVV